MLRVYGIVAAMAGLCLTLAGCGDSVGERAATGGIGGAVVGTALGGPLGNLIGNFIGDLVGQLFNSAMDGMFQSLGLPQSAQDAVSEGFKPRSLRTPEAEKAWREWLKTAIPGARRKHPRSK